MMVMLPSILSTHRAARAMRAACKRAGEQRRLMRNDVLAVKGLMPLLMKGRNDGRWTAENRAELRGCIRRLSVASPFLVMLMMPGGLLLLPLLAWWLDRRSRRRDGSVDAIERPSQ